MIGTIVALVAGIVPFLGLLTDEHGGAKSALEQERIVAKARAEALAHQENQQRLERARLNAEVVELRQTLKRLSKPSSVSRVTARLVSLQRRVKDDHTALKQLNEAILNTPAKSLALPLLRRDVQNQAAKYEDAIASTRSDMDRQYDLMKWVIGSLFLGILALLVGVLVPAFIGSNQAVGQNS